MDIKLCPNGVCQNTHLWVFARVTAHGIFRRNFQNMEGRFTRFLTVPLLVVLPFGLSAQFAYKFVTHTTFGKFRFDLYCKSGSFGFGQQFYPANFYNQSFYDVHVKGEYVATLVCGNEAVSNLDFTCKKYSAITHVDENDQYFPYGMPSGYGSDFTGLVPSADEKLCPGNEVTVQGWTDGSKSNTRDRITALQIRNLKLYAIQDDGSEVPITDQGVIINANPPAPISPAAAPNAGSSPRQQQQRVVVQQEPPPSPTPNAQQQASQAAADRYLNAVSPNNDAIQNASNLNLAKLNAQAAGNTAQVRQIQQLQQQQQQKNAGAVSQGAGDLATAVTGLINQRQARKEYEQQQVPHTNRTHDPYLSESL